MKHFFTLAILLFFSTICNAQLVPVFPVDTVYSSYDSLNEIRTLQHTIRIADGSKQLDKTTSTTIWETTDTIKYIDKTNFLFMTKTSVLRQHECVLVNKFETATIYDPSGTYKTLIQEEDKKSMVQYYSPSGKLLKTEKGASTIDFYKSIQAYYTKKKSKKK